jgi:hypothetical protein
MTDSSAPELRERLSPVPSWRVVFRQVIAVSLAFMVIQAGIALATPTPTPVLLVAPGGFVARALRTRGLSWGIMITALITALILAGGFWAALNAMHATRWSTVADGLCPIVAAGVAWVLERAVPPKPSS